MFALIAWVWLPASPESAWFLTEDERALAAKRVNGNRYDEGLGPAARGLAVRDIVEAVKDWKIWLLLGCNICASVPSTAFSVFLPLVVQGMGYSALEANLVSLKFLYVFACKRRDFISQFEAGDCTYGGHRHICVCKQGIELKLTWGIS